MKRTKETWRTAIARKKVSLPIRDRLVDELSDPCRRCLDYGCGRGYDAEMLGMFRYDPHFFPERPVGRFDRIYCGYVLNVLTKKEGQEVIDDIQSMMHKKSIAYIAVRRDMKPDNPNQRKVVLKGASCDVDNSKYALYCFWKNSEVKVI
jgi:hypothetical protein